MEERYRKIICPNGHASEVIKESQPFPRRCIKCRAMYLKNTKPIWCDANGNELIEESNNPSAPNDGFEMNASAPKDEIVTNTPARRPRKGSFFDSMEDQSVASSRNPFEDSASLTGKPFEDSIAPTGNPFEEPALAKPSEEVDSAKPFEQQNVSTGTMRYSLNSGDFSIVLEGEGIIGRENIGQEYLAVNPLVSRRHCTYLITNQYGLQIRDAGSLNGTYVDVGTGRTAVSKTTSSNLKTGDRIWLADMLFEVKEEK